MVRTPVYVLSTQQILVPLTEDWYQGQHPSPFMAFRQENGITWKRSRLPSVEISASLWQLVCLRTPRVCPIYTTNIGRIDKWFISRHRLNLFNTVSLSLLKKLRPYCRWEIPVAYLVCFVCINDWALHRIESLIRSKVFFVKWDLQQGKYWDKILERDVDMLLPDNCSPVYKWALPMKWASCRFYYGSPQIECGSS